MKNRACFVSNSSSCSFYITNKTREPKSLAHFASETKQLAERFAKFYTHALDGLTPDEFVEKFVASARSRCETITPGTHIVSFGDEDGDTVGMVFDYMLRDVGESESFSWAFRKYER